VYILTRKYRSMSLTLTQYWTRERQWDDLESKAKKYTSEAIAKAAMKRIMSSGREDEQNITVKKLNRTQAE
jgi:hypothetical protein